MEVLECLQCGGQIVLEENGQVGKCASCDTAYFFKAEKNARLISLLNQANISRLRGDYDSAILAYKIALKEDETDADAYWGITLSKFGIEYVEDERSGQLLPTCRRTMKHSVLSDEDYLNAISFSSALQKEDFTNKANEIDRLQIAIKEKIEQEQDYDVFLCFKSSDSNGNATEDRFIARQIYNELEKNDIKTFFSEVSLKDRLGQDYEPIIYKALYTAKIFILIATKEEYIQSPWVRNEWSRFLDRLLDEGMDNVSFAVFKDIKQNQLPPIFRTQGVDLAKYPAGGYEFEIADNLIAKLKGKKFATLDNMFSLSNSVMFEDKVVDLLEKKLVGSRQTYQEKIERALTYHEIGNAEKALEILDNIIDEYPRKAMGWFNKAKLLTNDFKINMSEFHTNEQLKKTVLFAIENSERFASEEEKEIIEQKTMPFCINVKMLETVDENLQELEDCFQKYVELESEKQEKTKQDNVNDQDLKQISLQALAANNAELKKVKKQVSSKKYYTKNISIPTSFMQSFFQMIGFFIIVVDFIASLINFIIARNDSGKMLSTLFEFVMLFTVGISPFIIVSILKNNAKIKQVKDYIQRDKDEYERLRNENQKIKALVAHQSQPNFEQTNEDEINQNTIDTQSLKAEKDIVRNYKKLKKLFNENSFVNEYIHAYEVRQKNNLFTRQQVLEEEKIALYKERKQIKGQLDKLAVELKEKKPKYLSESYEKLVKSTTILMDKFTSNKLNIEENLAKIDIENKLINLKLEKTVSGSKFFEGFLENHKENVEEYLKPKPKEESPAPVIEISTNKKNTGKSKKKKKSNLKR